MNKNLYWLIIIFFFSGCQRPSTFSDPINHPQVRFAKAEILHNLPTQTDLDIQFSLGTGYVDESYTITKKGEKLAIEAGDYQGLMYGGLELAGNNFLWKRDTRRF